MSIISQIGVVILIAFIIAVLVRANHTLEEVAEEGEHFVDEWAEKEERRELRKEQRLQLRQNHSSNLLKQEEVENETIGIDVDEPDDAEDETAWNTSNTPNTSKQNIQTQNMPKTEAGYNVAKQENAKIIPMRFPENENQVTLVELNVNHKPVRRIKIDHYPYTIGRGDENDLVLDDLCVARKHAQIEVMQGRVVLKDKGTANKIFSDGAIYTQIDLVANQKFYIGDVEFTTEVTKNRAYDTRHYVQSSTGR